MNLPTFPQLLFLKLRQFLQKRNKKQRVCALVLVILLFVLGIKWSNGDKENEHPGIIIDHVQFDQANHRQCVYFLSGEIRCESDHIPSPYKSLIDMLVDLKGKRTDQK